jgi:galactokinase
MDQACIFGKTPVLLTFTAKVDIRVEPVFPRGGMSLFFVDLRGRKDTVRILSDLQGAYEQSEPLQQALGGENERIIRLAYQALTEGDAAGLGAAMTESQEVFDRLVAPHSPQQLAGSLLHQVLSLPEIQPHVYGGKGVGSQGDGTAQFVARSQADRDEAMAIIERRLAPMRCFPLSIVPADTGR